MASHPPTSELALFRVKESQAWARRCRVRGKLGRSLWIGFEFADKGVNGFGLVGAGGSKASHEISVQDVQDDSSTIQRETRRDKVDGAGQIFYGSSLP